MNHLMSNRKMKRGSVLVFSILILSIMLVTSLTILSSALLDRKASLSTGSSTKSFQVADSGVEEVLYQVYQEDRDTLSALATALGGSCDSTTGKVSFSVAGGQAKVSFYEDETALYANKCSGSPFDWRNNVVKIKVEGTAGSTTRAVEVAVKSKNSVLKPSGMASSSGASSPTVLSRGEARYVLINVPFNWASVETSRGTYDFSAIDTQIENIVDAGKGYSLAIPAGPNSPSWLMNSDTVNDGIESDWISFSYVNPNNGNAVDGRVPLAWDATAQAEIRKLANALGSRYNSDPNLKLVYVGQFTQNGNEGLLPRQDSFGANCRLGGVIGGCGSWNAVGYTDDRWADAVLDIVGYYADAFPDKAIAVELHDVIDATVPSAAPKKILDGIAGNSDLKDRVGAAIWWLSGKEDYQSELLGHLRDFSLGGGDVYAQLIGKSSQPARFKDDDFTTIFDQARDIGIRYIEAWEWEYKPPVNGSWNTYQSNFQDFNTWADSNF